MRFGFGRFLTLDPLNPVIQHTRAHHEGDNPKQRTNHPDGLRFPGLQSQEQADKEQKPHSQRRSDHLAN
jgi:hypothetical protein